MSVQNRSMPSPTGQAIGLRLELALDVQLEARRFCRSGLVGLRVGYLGSARTIRSTMWGADDELGVWLDGMDRFEPPVPPGDLVLLSPWPAKCCRPTARRLRAAIARKAGGH